MRKPHTRRDFLHTAAVAGAGIAASPYLALARTRIQDEKPQEEKPTTNPAYAKLRVAFIGCGGIGGHHFDTTKEIGVSCAAMCDVDTGHFKKGKELYPDAPTFQDYRQMFDKEGKNIDAVMVGTPDHHHYPATAIAMQLGKHVYTQKPLTHTVWEARQLTLAAQKYKLATQMGNQGHALEGWRLLVEWVQSGAIGDVKEVHTWTDRPIWPQGVERPKEEDPVPESLNWDVWLGPAPTRPYKAKTYHAFAWRGWWDFGAGALGDMACHTMDGLFWALDPGHPTAIEPVASTPINNETYPKSSIVKWEFPAKGSRAAFAAYWYDGGLKPSYPPAFEYGRKLPDTGNLFIGTKASILVSGDYGESPRIFPESKMKEIGKPPKVLERSPGHQREWVMACVGEKPLDFPKSNFAYSGPMTETITLGNVALRVGRRIEWDAANLKVTNLPEANQYISKEYREGWKFSI
jgi:predicted dehydrogenase